LPAGLFSPFSSVIGSFSDATLRRRRKSAEAPKIAEAVAQEKSADGLAICGLASSVKGFPAFLMRPA
jgi:hypothetical protein